MFKIYMCRGKNPIKSPQGLKLKGWEFTAACGLHGDVSDFKLGASTAIGHKTNKTDHRSAKDFGKHRTPPQKCVNA